MPVEFKEIPLTMGVNLLQDRMRISDLEVVRAKNVWPSRSGKPGKRYGTEFSALGTTANPTPVNMRFSPFGVVDYVSIACTTTLGSEAMAVDAGYLDGTFVAGLGLNYILGHRPMMVPFNNKIWIGATPTSGGYSLVAAYEDPTVAAGYSVAGKAFNGTGNGLTPRVLGVYRNRMVYADFIDSNLGAGQRQTLIFSDRDDPQTIGNDAYANRRIRISGMGGDRIVAVVEVPSDALGSPTTSSLLILGEYTAFLMAGEPALSTDTGEYIGTAAIVQIKYPCGCASPQTIVRTPYGLMWASWDDVWYCQSGSLPVRVGTKIGPALAQTPADKRYLWHAAFFNGAYRLAIGSDGQGMVDFDKCGEQWWLDLRDGPPQGHADARWWGPQQYLVSAVVDTAPTMGTYIMALDDRPGKDPTLYGLHAVTGGISVFCNVIKFDAVAGYDNAINESIDDLVDNEIAIEILTKEYDFQDGLIDKLYLGTEILLWTGEVCELSVETIVDGGRTSSIRSIEVDQVGFIGGVDAAGGSQNVSKEHLALAIQPDPATRQVGKTLQWRLYDTPGYPVIANGIDSQMYVGLSAAGAGGGLYAEFTSSVFYANLATFLTALVAKLNAVTTPVMTISHNQTAAPRSGLVTLTNGLGTDFRFEFASVGSSTNATILRHTRKVGAMIGMSTAAALVSTAGVATATDKARYKLSAALELGGIVMRYYYFGRRPNEKRESA